MKPLLKEVLSILPLDKAKLYLGFCPPQMVIELVQMGVDMFDTSFPTYMAENGQGLVFPNQNPVEGDVDGTRVDHDWIDLRLDRYKNDFAPIVKNCTCYTCQKHTRAYIYHLLATNELLAPILLTIHNLHHYGIFFETIRKLTSLGKLQLLQKLIVSKRQ